MHVFLGILYTCILIFMMSYTRFVMLVLDVGPVGRWHSSVCSYAILCYNRDGGEEGKWERGRGGGGEMATKGRRRGSTLLPIETGV